MKASNNTVFLVLAAAVVIGGAIAKRGELVEVTNSEARDLLNRKKARIATAEDGVEVSDPAPAGVEVSDPAPAGAEDGEQTADQSDQEQKPAASRKKQSAVK